MSEGSRKRTLTLVLLPAAALALVTAGVIKGGPPPEENRPKPQVAALSPEAPPTKAPNWVYQSIEDEMGRGTTKIARTTSLNAVTFGPPYDRIQHGRLSILHARSHWGSILSITTGQFNLGIDGCSVLVRFDEKKAERFHGVGPADHSTTILFMTPESRFLAGLKGSKLVRIEAPFYQEGSQIFEFNTEGLDWEKLSLK